MARHAICPQNEIAWRSFHEDPENEKLDSLDDRQCLITRQWSAVQIDKTYSLFIVAVSAVGGVWPISVSIKELCRMESSLLRNIWFFLLLKFANWWIVLWIDSRTDEFCGRCWMNKLGIEFVPRNILCSSRWIIFSSAQSTVSNLRRLCETRHSHWNSAFVNESSFGFFF